MGSYCRFCSWKTQFWLRIYQVSCILKAHCNAIRIFVIFQQIHWTHRCSEISQKSANVCFSHETFPAWTLYVGTLERDDLKTKSPMHYFPKWNFNEMLKIFTPKNWEKSRTITCWLYLYYRSYLNFSDLVDHIYDTIEVLSYQGSHSIWKTWKNG